MPRNAPNPFLFGKPVDGEHFCNRRNELRRLRELFASQNSGWLYSPRRYGKTSLIREAFALTDDPDLYTAYVDLLGLQAGLSPAALFLRGIGPLVSRMSGGGERALAFVGSVVKSFVPALTLGEDGRPVLSVTPAAGSRHEPDLDEVLALPERLAERHAVRVVIAIDEFQEVASVKGLEAQLRTIFQQQRRVSYLMAGSQASLLKTMFTSPERPFFQFGEHIPIRRIEEVELLRYVRGRFEHSGIVIRDRTLEAIVREARNHPHFVQYFASVAWDLRNGGRADDEQFLRRLVDRVVSALDPGFRAFFEGLAASQKRILLDAARHGGRSLLSGQRRRDANLGGASTVASALKVLADKEVMAKEGDSWEFVNPAFRLWVRERAIPRPPD